MYDDYIELQPGAASRLQISLNERARREETTTLEGGSAFMHSFSGTIWNIYMKARRAIIKEEQGLPLQQPPPIVSEQQQAAPPPQPAEALFLPLCQNVSIYDKKLSHLSVCGIDSDEKIFRALNDHYRSRFTSWWSFVSFRTLTGIKFVKFELYRKSQSVDVRLKNDVPAPDNPDYRYAPVPIDLMPPVGEDMLMHLFYNPKCAEDVPACLERFPKKLREKLTCGEKAVVPGWGLQLEEGVSNRKTAIIYLICVLVSSIWGVLWAVLEHDIQGAFTVSAYVIGITVPLATLMQHLV